MNFNALFVLVVLVLAAITGSLAAPQPRWKGWKKLEKVGQNVFKAAAKTLPVAQGYAGLAAGAKLGK